MIVRPTPRFHELFFIAHGSIVPRIMPQLICIAVLSTAVVLLHDYFPHRFPNYTAAPFTLFGLALSIFLSFRNQSCYDRWWEGRKMWGQLVYDARSFARQTRSLISGEDEWTKGARQRLFDLAAAFPHALRHLLRGEDVSRELRPILGADLSEKVLRAGNGPNIILDEMAGILAACRDRGALSDITLKAMDERLTSMAHLQAACERILRTPLPFAYTLLLHRTAYLYCILLPFGLVDSLGSATPVAVVIVTYTLFGLDALSQELEEPFGTAHHDLALTTMCRAIERDLREIAGDAPLPPLIQPNRYNLP